MDARRKKASALEGFAKWRAGNAREKLPLNPDRAAEIALTPARRSTGSGRSQVVRHDLVPIPPAPAKCL